MPNISRPPRRTLRFPAGRRLIREHAPLRAAPSQEPGAVVSERCRQSSGRHDRSQWQARAWRCSKSDARPRTMIPPVPRKHPRRTHMAEPPIHDTLNAAREHHQAGRLQEAEVLYRQVLGKNPDQPDALHGLGTLARTGWSKRHCTESHRTGGEARASVAAYQHSYGEMCLAVGQPNQAMAAFRRALQLAGSRPESHVGLGIALAPQPARLRN